jgi:hypothetical protein
MRKISVAGGAVPDINGTALQGCEPFSPNLAPVGGHYGEAEAAQMKAKAC